MTSDSGGTGADANAPESPPSSSRSRLRKVAVAAAGLVLLLAAAEILLRAFYYTPALPQVYTEYGWIQAPGSAVINSGEGYSRSRISSLGFFDDEVRPERPPLRAVLLGDSYAQALQVARSRSFAAVAERAVDGLELINTGQAGRDPIHYAAYLQPLYDLLEPDLAVVQVNDGDVGNLRDSGYLDLDADEAIDRFLEREPNLIGERGFSRPLQWLARHSALATFVYRRLTILGRAEKARLEGKFTADDPAAGADTLGAVDPRIGELMDGFLARMRRTTDRLVFLYIPNVIYSSSGCDPKFPERREFYHDFARRNHVMLVDTFDAIAREYAATGQPLHGFHNSRMGGGHINAQGHRIVGMELAGAVREMAERIGAGADSTR